MIWKFCTVLCLVGLISTNASASIIGFTGAYDPLNWTLTSSNGGDGSVDTSGAPAAITLTGANNNVGLSDTDYSIVLLGAGNIEFDWNYLTTDVDGPGFDPFGYVLNGTFTQLTANNGPDSQSGSETIAVSIGDVFAFRVRATDSALGSASTTSVNFSGPAVVPEPSTYIVFTCLILCFGFDGWRRKRLVTSA